MSFAISIIGCIFGCRISNAPNYEYQTQHHFCIGEPEKERSANRGERTHPYACRFLQANGLSLQQAIGLIWRNGMQTSNG